jgi:hypothetical protein
MPGFEISLENQVIFTLLSFSRSSQPKKEIKFCYTKSEMRISALLTGFLVGAKVIYAHTEALSSAIGSNADDAEL